MDVADLQAALGAIHPVSRETIERLEAYRALLLRWQQKTNLVAPGTLDDFWTRHVADSLQLFALKPDAKRWIDLGSGGGFPGLVIGCMLAEQTWSARATAGRGMIHLVESNNKKCAFLRQVATRCGLPVEVYGKRVEDVSGLMEDTQVITARALAPLEKLLSWCGPYLTDGRIALFPKGRDFQREIEECRGRWAFDLIEHLSVTAADSRILEICNARRA